METQLDLPTIRGILAARRIPHKRLAEAAVLSQHYVYRILCGAPHGELARVRLARGLRALGIPEAIPAVGLPFLEEEEACRAS